VPESSRRTIIFDRVKPGAEEVSNKLQVLVMVKIACFHVKIKILFCLKLGSGSNPVWLLLNHTFMLDVHRITLSDEVKCLTIINSACKSDNRHTYSFPATNDFKCLPL
jgi:hypothetical protein